MIFDDLKPFILFYTVGQTRVPYLDRSQLIELKKSSLRPQDQIDVIRLSELD